MLLSFIFSLYLLLTGSASSVATEQGVAAVNDCVVADCQMLLERTDRLHGIEDHRHRSEPALNSSRDLFRISVSRPQRLLPVYGSKNSRPFGKSALQDKSNPLKHNLLPCSRQALPAPLHGAASCEYYVFALRRILC